MDKQELKCRQSAKEMRDKVDCCHHCGAMTPKRTPSLDDALGEVLEWCFENKIVEIQAQFFDDGEPIEIETVVLNGLFNKVNEIKERYEHV